MGKSVSKMFLYEFPNLKIEIYKTQGNTTWKNLCHLRITPKGTKTYEHMVRYDKLLRGTDELEVLRYFNRCLTNDDLQMLRHTIINICDGEQLKYLTRYEGYTLNEIIKDIRTLISTDTDLISYEDTKYKYIKIKDFNDLVAKRKDTWVTTKEKLIDDLLSCGTMEQKSLTGHSNRIFEYYAFNKNMIGANNE